VFIFDFPSINAEADWCCGRS